MMHAHLLNIYQFFPLVFNMYIMVILNTSSLIHPHSYSFVGHTVTNKSPCKKYNQQPLYHSTQNTYHHYHTYFTHRRQLTIICTYNQRKFKQSFNLFKENASENRFFALNYIINIFNYTNLLFHTLTHISYTHQYLSKCSKARFVNLSNQAGRCSNQTHYFQQT